jgi:EutQ-like cupin domain
MEGEVKVSTPEGEVVEFGAGDLMTLPRGLKCTWEVRKPVRKHYRFTSPALCTAIHERFLMRCLSRLWVVSAHARFRRCLLAVGV